MSRCQTYNAPMNPVVPLMMAVLMQGPVLPKGIHNLTLQRPGAAPIHYAISIPANMSPTTPVPLILALPFGGEPQGAGQAVLQVLVEPGLGEPGANIASP